MLTQLIPHLCCESKDVDVTPNNQAMIKASPNIYKQSSPLSVTSSTMMSTTAPYPADDFLSVNSMHFDCGTMSDFWASNLYDTNHNTNGYYQHHPPTIHS